MKRFLIKFLIGVLALSLLVSGLVACGSASKDFKYPTLTNPGKVESLGGFISETENYLYFINGVANNTDDNAFGAPVKGALMVQDKSDLKKEPQVVVPKLFVASDYDAGVYIYNGRVYYGTPSVEKNSSGEIANDELTFMSTKLDGTGSETYFTIDSLSAEYRMIESNGAVYIVYYDTDQSALCYYNTKDNASGVIIKTDAKAEGEEAVSLASYKFLDNVAVGKGFAVAYTVTIYNEEYYESAAKEEGYSRATKSYNEVYVYGVNGEKVESKKILDGKEKEITYAITYINGESVYASATDVLTNVENISYNLVSAKTETVKNADLIADGNLILDDGKVLTLKEGVITIRNAMENDFATQEKLAIVDSANSLVRYDQVNGYIYYLDSGNTLARIKASDENAKVELVSEDILITAWYAPQFITIGEDDYVFYVDGSTKGASYVKYVKLNADAVAEDTDDDGENDKFYLEGHNFLAKRLDKDVAAEVGSTINDVANDINDSGALGFNKVDGKLTVESVTKAKALYDSKTDAVKALVSEDAVENLNNYLDAIKWANEYDKLSAIRKVKELSTDEYNALKTAYESVKADIEEFRNSDNYAVVRTLLGNDLNNYYQRAVEEFED